MPLSKMGAQSRFSAPQTTNCTSENFSEGQSPAKVSIKTMCAVQKNAPISTTRSPNSTDCAPSAKLTKYSPTMATAAPIHASARMRLCMKMPQNGTKTMYRPVIKPAFAELPVSEMPYCCSADAEKRMAPQTEPLMRRFFHCLPLSLPRSKSRTTGISESAPIIKRIPLNQKVPSVSPPSA